VRAAVGARGSSEHKVQIAPPTHATKPRTYPAQTRYLPLPQRRIKVRAPS
jgi:hypothetical protein